MASFIDFADFQNSPRTMQIQLEYEQNNQKSLLKKTALVIEKSSNLDEPLNKLEVDLQRARGFQEEKKRLIQEKIDEEEARIVGANRMIKNLEDALEATDKNKRMEHTHYQQSIKELKTLKDTLERSKGQ